MKLVCNVLCTCMFTIIYIRLINVHYSQVQQRRQLPGNKKSKEKKQRQQQQQQQQTRKIVQLYCQQISFSEHSMPLLECI